MGIFSKIKGLLKIELKMMAAYRFEMAITVIVAPVSLIVFYFLWQAIYTNTGVDIIRGFTFHQLITYYVVGWIIGVLTYTHVEDALSYEVRKGLIIKDMLKPVNYIIAHFFYTIGHRAYAAVIEAIPILIIGFVFFRVQFNLLYFALFLLAVVFALILIYLISALVGMTAFWIVYNRGVIKLKRILITFLSGAILPLTFFPYWFQNLSHFMPFQYLTFIPINIWLAKYTLPKTFQLLGIQIIWIIIFYFIVNLVWKAAMRKVAAVGI